MRKRRCKIVASILLVLFLFGCSRSLGERAIVKIVYLDEADGQIQAGIAVFLCEPNSDTASVEGEAKIYTAQGSSIEEALYQAELQQNKKAFYAQNEILLLGPGIARDVTPALTHFEQESAARPNLMAFLTPLTIEEFAECEENISDVVREGERLMGGGINGGKLTQSIFEIELSDTERLNGYLPVFSFSKEDKDFCGVRQIALIRDGAPYCMIEDAPMQFFLLLAGKTDRLEIYTQIDGQTVSFHAQQLRLTRTASAFQGIPELTVNLNGTVDNITMDGIPVERTQQTEVIQAINQYLDALARELDEVTFARGNDVFHYEWWMRQNDASVCDKLLEKGTLFETARVELVSALEPV